jgi:DNA-binding NarL/FixJ family response regulator
MRKTSILVADAVPIFRTGVRRVLVREGDFQVVEAAQRAEVEAIVSDEAPDVALIDLDLVPDGGVSLVADLARRSTMHTIVWSFGPTRQTVLAAIQAGASGYLHKEISSRGLIRAIRGISAGEAPLARDLATLMIDALHHLEERAQARERAAVLSRRERQVLGLVASGARNKEIAEELIISEFTVKRHVQNILQKLELPSRHAAAGFHESAFGSEGCDSDLILRTA